MNKKIVGFVLAMCLVFCFGVVKASYEGEGSSRMDATISSLGTYTVSMSSSSSMSSVPVALRPSVKTLIKSIGGITVGGANADGSFDVYRNGQAFMSYKLKEGENGDESKGWSVKSINADYATLKALGFDASAFSDYYDVEYDEEGNIKGCKLKSGKNEEDVINALVSALGKFGVTANDFKSFKTDENGNVKTDSNGNKLPATAVSWLGEMVHSLLRGLNYSVQIDFSASSGASCSFIANGQLQYTLNASGLCTVENHYNEQGFLEYSTELTFEPDETNTNTGTTKYHAVKKRTYYNDHGNPEETWQLGKNDKKEKLVTTYNYYVEDSDGSKRRVSYLVSSTDTSTKVTTHYKADGRTDHLTNAKDGTSSVYVYRQNGTLEKIENRGKNGAITSTQIFSKAGQSLGTTTNTIPGSYGDASDYYYEMIRQAKSKGNDKKAIYEVLDKFGFTGKGGISIYDYMAKDSSYDSLLTTIGVTDARKSEMLLMSNGYSALGYVTNIAKGAAKNRTTVNSTKTLNGSFADYSTDVVDDEGEAITSEITLNNKGFAYRIDEGYCELRAGVVKHIKYTDPAVEGKLWSPEVTDEELKAAMEERGIDKDDEKAIASLKTQLSRKKLEAKAKELGIDINDEKAMEDLKNGFYTDANGQTYAIVDANSINIMDGKGFHAAEGETVLVAVDNMTKDKIIDNVNSSGDRSIMFMGNVRESVNGHLTMTMEKSYGGGYVQGSAEVQSAVKDISEKSMKVAAARYAYEQGEMSEQEYNKIVKDAGWVGNNTNENLQKYANGNFSWDNDKTANQNLRDAWRVLLNF